MDLKKPLSFEDQLNKLEEHGVIVHDEETAISILKRIGCLVPLGIGAYLISNSVDLEKEPVAKVASGIKTSTESTISRLDKLADLLDKGIITQQEFDEKKKQIL